MSYFKKSRLVFFMICFLGMTSYIHATTLKDGDIAFTRINLDDNTFSFVFLVDVENTTTFNITDEAYDGTIFHNLESTIEFTANSDISAGTEIHVDSSTMTLIGSSGSIRSIGTVDPLNGSMFSSSGDNLFAYQDTNIVAGISSEKGDSGTSGDAWQSGTSMRSDTLLPSDKTNGQNGFLGLFPNGSSPSEVDNANYKNSALHTGTKEEILAAIMNLSNWEFDPSTPFSISTRTAFDIVSSNTAPTNTLPSAPTVNEDDKDIAFADDIAIADTNNDNQSVTLTATNGTLSMITTGVTVTTGDGTDDAVIAFNGTLANVNTALDSLTFTPTANFNGTATLRMQTDDGNSGIDDDTLNITVSAVDDIQTITSTPIASIDEDSVYSYTLVGDDVDGDDLNWSVKSGTTLPSWLNLNAITPTVSTFSSHTITTTLSDDFEMDTDSDGNIFTTNSAHDSIIKITPAGDVSTFVGGDGSFTNIVGLAIDSLNNIYISDKSEHKIKKITQTGVVTTFAGSTSGFADATGESAQFKYPNGLAIDKEDNIYVADSQNHRIRKITPAGVVTTVIGDGTAGITDSRVYYPRSVALDSNDNLYIPCNNYHIIRKVTQSGVASTFAGISGSWGSDNGVSTSAKFHLPWNISIDKDDNLFIMDKANHTIRKITQTGDVTTYSGTDSSSGSNNGKLETATFYKPTSSTIDKDGNLYILDTQSIIGRDCIYQLRKITSPIQLIGTPSNADVGEHNISIVVNDGTNSVDHNFTITVANTNDAVTDISLSSNSISENNTSDTLIGTLNSTDIDVGDTFTYSLCGGTDDTSFTISENKLKTNAIFDYETKSSYSICVKSTDSGSETFDKNITISITNVDESVSGICGSADVSTFTSAPTSGLCNKGTASSVTQSGDKFIWNCNGTTVGTDTGTDANCDAGVQSSTGTDTGGDSGTDTGSGTGTGGDTGTDTDTTSVKVISIPDILVDINSSKFVEINGTQTSEHNLSQYFTNTTSYIYTKKDSNSTVEWLNLNSTTGDINLTTNIVENNSSLVDTKHYIKITGLNSDTNISTYFTVRFKDLNASLASSITKPSKTTDTNGTTEDGTKYSTATKDDSNVTVYSDGTTKHQIKDKATATSKLPDSKITMSANGDLNTTASTINNSGDEVEIEVIGKADDTITAIHSLKVNGKETKATSSLPNTSTIIRTDRIVETNATINSTTISVQAKPDGTAQHIVSKGGQISKVTSKIQGAITTIKSNGDVQTSAGEVDDNNGYYIKGEVITSSDGTSITRFVKVNKTNPNDRKFIENTMEETTPFEIGNESIIETIDTKLYIKTVAPLGDTNLIVE